MGGGGAQAAGLNVHPASLLKALEEATHGAGAGHLSAREQPCEVTDAMLSFLCGLG